MFYNRQHAGQLLAEKVVASLRQRDDIDWRSIVIVGLPRGGVPVAREVAVKLSAPLTILASKKIGAPGQPEFAIGAVSSTGATVLNEELLPLRGRLGDYIDSERRRLAGATKLLEEQWLRSAGLVQQSFKDKIVVIVDDGIATGMTAVAAARSIRASGARFVIIAAPVMAYQTLSALQEECDQVVTVLAPRDLMAVGHYYQDFDQTEEAAMIDVLSKQSNEPPKRSA